MATSNSNPFQIAIRADSPLRFVDETAVNEITEAGFTSVPVIGKHTAWAYVDDDSSAYIFGGDGDWPSSEGSSAGWHFGRWNARDRVMDGFYPYFGRPGEPVPAGADAVPFVYDRRRRALWNVGGFWWRSGSIHEQSWLGTTDSEGVWRFDLDDGLWRRPSTESVPRSDLEGLTAIHHADRDWIIGVNADELWWYGCADDSRGRADIAGIEDDRDLGRLSQAGYDETRDELLVVGPWDGNLYGIDLSALPGSTNARHIADVPAPGPTGAWGQFPAVYVPSRRQLVLFYTRDVGIKVVDIDTGAVWDGPAFPASLPADKYINAAVYASDLDLIVASGKDGQTIYELGWV